MLREAVYLAMAGVVPSIEAAFEMDGVMRSAAVTIVGEIEESQRRALMRAVSMAMGVS